MRHEAEKERQLADEAAVGGADYRIYDGRVYGGTLGTRGLCLGLGDTGIFGQ
ncbi:hypothetical protein D081_2368 [Anaerovibrio sp. JC8]|nr:hypothetical protein D081_2368 [Anaerovibrio sp. JC8]